MNQLNKFQDLISTLDYIVFFSMLSITFIFIFYGQKKSKQLKEESHKILDLMLMGRRLTLPIFTATLVATWYGGIFGVAEIAFSSGIYNFVTQGFFWYLSYLVFAFFLVKKVTSYEAVTLPDLVGRMFGPRSEKFAAIFNIINLIPIAYCISIGLFIKMIFNIPLELATVLGVAIVLSYSLIGGFRSVVYSDIFQFGIMTSAVFMVFLFSLSTYGLTHLQSLPAHYFHPMGTSSLSETLSWGLIAFGTLVDPNFYQRCFAAKDFTVAKNGILLATALWVLFDLSLTFGAMYAKATFPAEASSHGYFYYALHLLPNGLRGFFLAGVCATILSTLDSYIFLAGSTFAFDLIPVKFRERPIVHRLGMVSVGVVAVFFSFIFEGNIKDVWKALGSISTAALLGPILYGHISKSKVSDFTFLLGASFGAITTVTWRLSGLKTYYQIDEIYIGVLFSLLGIVLAKCLTSFRVTLK